MLQEVDHGHDQPMHIEPKFFFTIDLDLNDKMPYTEASPKHTSPSLKVPKKSGDRRSASQKIGQ